MSNWKQIIAARARHGSFVGNGTANEDDYYEFFGGSDSYIDLANGTLIANFSKVFRQLKPRNVTFEEPVRSLFLKQSINEKIGAGCVGQCSSER
ncbi:MAG: hypothetical protein AAGF25_13125 [Pseudomonadota bacterium]